MERRGIMKELGQLLEKIEYRCIAGSMDVCVDAVVYDSRKITDGCLFLCIAGANADGHDFAGEAVEKGVRVLVVEKDIPMERMEGVTVVRVEDTRYAMAYCGGLVWESGRKNEGDRNYGNEGEDDDDLSGQIYFGECGA